MRSLLGWILILSFGNAALASDASTLLNHLQKRLTSLSENKGSLIKSFEERDQSYVYDQALAIIAFSKAGKKAEAQSLLRGLQGLQNADGSLYFSYYLNGKSDYPQQGDKRFAGALAWVALSVSHFEKAFQAKEFTPFHQKLLLHLKGELHPLKIKGQKALALRFNPTDLEGTNWKENETAALEHNLDLLAAFNLDSELNANHDHQEAIEGLKTFVLSLWDKQRKHFWSGMNLETGIINQEEIYLDNQTWSLLALGDKDLQKLDIQSALELNCDELLVKHQGVHGFRDRRPVRGPAGEDFVWSEGTLGQILALEKVRHLTGKTLKCEGKTAADFLESLKRMKQTDGGIAYATSGSDPDFTTSSSIAGSTWMFFALRGINPFES